MREASAVAEAAEAVWPRAPRPTATVAARRHRTARAGHSRRPPRAGRQEPVRARSQALADNWPPARSTAVACRTAEPNSAAEPDTRARLRTRARPRTPAAAAHRPRAAAPAPPAEAAA